MSAVLASTASALSPLARWDGAGPRYTSYPTADRFHEGHGEAAYREVLTQRAALGGEAPPLSVYVHIPFCESVCYFCACNKIVTRRHERAAAYLHAIEREIALVSAALVTPQPIRQLHFGGGSPTFLSDVELERLLHAVRAAFPFDAGAELSIEVDPRTVTPARLVHLRALGFQRISFGVQDFDDAVQQAVHRLQPLAQVAGLMRSARDLGFRSINTDLIYGLPRQTPQSFARTVGQLAALRPDRVALYGYAHLPQRFKPQRRIHDADLPDAAQRLAMLRGAIDGLGTAGYDYIGMDHFALPGDDLAAARREGRLQRNFQGYTCGPVGDLIGLGVSAIGQIGTSYQQNVKTIEAYEQALQRGTLPIERGATLSADDRLRRDVVMALMCRGRLDFEQIERRHHVAVPAYFATELQELRAMAKAGIVDLEPAAVQVTEAGWYVVRAVAMVFDRYLHSAAPRGQQRFSRVV